MSTAAKASLSALAAQTATGESLGDIVWWRLTGRYSHEVLRTEFVARGLDEKLLPSPMDTERAFRRAVRRTVQGHGHGSSKLVRPVADDGEIVLGVVSEHTDSKARELDYQVTDQVTFNKATGIIHSTSGSGTMGHAVTAETKSLEKMVEGLDLTRALVKWIDGNGGCALRDDGGVYWVPPTAGPLLRKIGEAIEAATVGACAIYPLPIARTASGEAERGLAESARAGLEAQISGVAAEITEFQSEAPRRSTLERRLKKFEELRARATMYRDVLRVSSSDLETQIGTMETAVAAMLANMPTLEQKAEKAAQPKAAKCEKGEKVKLKEEVVSAYAASGLNKDEVLTVDEPGPVRGTVWVLAGVGLRVMVAKNDLWVA